MKPPGLPPQSGPLGAIVRVSRSLRCKASLVSLARSREADGERRGSGPRRFVCGVCAQHPNQPRLRAVLVD